MADFLFGFIAGVIITFFVINLILTSKDAMMFVMRRYFSWYTNSIVGFKKQVRDNQKTIKDSKDFLKEMIK